MVLFIVFGAIAGRCLAGNLALYKGRELPLITFFYKNCSFFSKGFGWGAVKESNREAL